MIHELEMLHRRCPMGVFSHDEAFYYYGLTDREPLVHTLTIYSGYNVHRLKEDGYKVYMTKNGCRIGGEQSGHIIFSKYSSTGDGILTSLKMMEVMLARKKKMSELSEGFTVYPQVLKNIRVHNKAEAQNDNDVQAAVKAVAEKLGESGRILVRESGTEPVIRVMVEAESEETCQKYVDEVIAVIKAKGHAV